MTLRSLPPALARRLGGAALIAASAFILCAPVQAQVFVRPFYYGGTWSGPLVMPAPEGPRRLPLDALYEEIGDQGYRPLGVVSRTRDTVVIDALTPNERRVRLTVDAFDGEILSRRPLPGTAAQPGPARGAVRTVPESERNTAPQPPRKRVVQSPAPPRATPTPQGLNPAARPAPTAPVAPARDPSQWGKEG